MKSNKKWEAVFAIVNHGYSEDVIEVTRELGAKGGTIISARGSIAKDAESKFNIVVNEEKEMVMIIVPSEIKDEILKGLYEKIGTGTKAQGIAYSLPVDGAVGLK